MTKALVKPRVTNVKFGAINEEIVEVLIPMSTRKLVGGGMYSITPHIGISVMCTCSRNTNISKETLELMRTEIDTIGTQPPRKVKIISCKFVSLNPGSLFMVKDNPNSHSYPLLTPIMKISTQYSVDICKSWPEGLRFGNQPPPDVYQIMSGNKAFVESIPIEFRNLIKVEEFD